MGRTKTWADGGSEAVPDSTLMTEQKTKVGDVEIAYETFGDAGAPPLVLVMGLGGQMIAWHDEFVQTLANRGHFVVRFDNRDVGESTHFHDAQPDIAAALGGDFSSAAYTLTDMAADTAGLLAALDIDSAHMVGISMGGMIVQEFAIRHADRTRSLTSIMSTPAPDVAPPTDAAMATLLRPPAQSREEVVAGAPEMWRVIGSPGYEHDVEWIKEVAGRQYDRGFDPMGTMRQLIGIQASGDRRPALADVTVPTVVIHGEADPLVPLPGGQATADAVPDAKLVTFSGMGHDLPRALWPAIVEEICANVQRAEQQG